MLLFWAFFVVCWVTWKEHWLDFIRVSWHLTSLQVSLLPWLHSILSQWTLSKVDARKVVQPWTCDLAETEYRCYILPPFLPSRCLHIFPSYSPLLSISYSGSFLWADARYVFKLGGPSLYRLKITIQFFASCPESRIFFSHLRNHGKRIFPLTHKMLGITGRVLRKTCTGPFRRFAQAYQCTEWNLWFELWVCSAKMVGLTEQEHFVEWNTTDSMAIHLNCWKTKTGFWEKGKKGQKY